MKVDTKLSKYGAVCCSKLHSSVGTGIKLVFIPKGCKITKIWALKLKRDGFELSPYTKLCERHFEKDPFAVNPDCWIST